MVPADTDGYASVSEGEGQVVHSAFEHKNTCHRVSTSSGGVYMFSRPSMYEQLYLVSSLCDNSSAVRCSGERSRQLCLWKRRRRCTEKKVIYRVCEIFEIPKA